MYKMKVEKDLNETMSKRSNSVSVVISYASNMQELQAEMRERRKSRALNTTSMMAESELNGSINDISMSVINKDKTWLERSVIGRDSSYKFN